MRRRGAADPGTALDNDAVDEVDLGAPTLLHVLTHRRPLCLAAPLRVAQGQHQRLDLLQGAAVAFRRTRKLLRVLAGDVLEFVALRLAYPHRLTAELDDELADAIVLAHRVAAEPRRSRHTVMHAVDAELRPAFAPEVVGDPAGVDCADHRAQFLDPRGHSAVHLADPVDLVPWRVFRAGAADLAGGVKLGREQRGDRADRLAPADDAGDALLVDAVLQRHHVAARRQVLPHHRRRPFRVVRLRRDEADVDRSLPGEVLHFGQVQRLWPGAHEFHFADPLERQPILADRLDMLGPRVDQRDVEADMREVPAGISADRTGAEHNNPLVHGSSLSSSA